eukprot:1152134-Pelagomonas_calceolata.AAC.3
MSHRQVACNLLLGGIQCSMRASTIHAPYRLNTACNPTAELGSEEHPHSIAPCQISEAAPGIQNTVMPRQKCAEAGPGREANAMLQNRAALAHPFCPRKCNLPSHMHWCRAELPLSKHNIAEPSCPC